MSLKSTATAFFITGLTLGVIDFAAIYGLPALEANDNGVENDYDQIVAEFTENHSAELWATGILGGVCFLTAAGLEMANHVKNKSGNSNRLS